MRRACLAAGLAGLLLTAFAAVPARADDTVDEVAREARRPKTQESVSIDVGEEGMQPPLTTGGDSPPAAVVWPTPAAATVAVPGTAGAASKQATDQGSAAPGGLPVTVGAPAEGATAAPSAVRVEVLDRTIADRAGIDGLLLSVSRIDGKAGSAEVSLGLDYSTFAQAYGGDWASRLRLASVPACAATTPDEPQCRTATPLDTRNDLENERIVADVPAPAAPAVPAGTKQRAAAASACWRCPVGRAAAPAVMRPRRWRRRAAGRTAATRAASTGSTRCGCRRRWPVRRRS